MGKYEPSLSPHFATAVAVYCQLSRKYGIRNTILELPLELKIN
jgi:hypothetical protein